MTMSPLEAMEFDKAWTLIQEGLEKLVLHGFRTREYATLCSNVHRLCLHFPGSHKENFKILQMYDRYKQCFDHVTKMVHTSLIEEHDEVLLREFVSKWENYAKMMRRLSIVFQHLDRYFTKTQLSSVKEVSHASFQSQVYAKMKLNIKHVLIFWISRERMGEQINRPLLKKTLETFKEIGGMEAYEKDFENDMLAYTAAYYSTKAASWIRVSSFSGYMLEAEECLEREKERAADYLQATSEPKLLERVQHELLLKYANALLKDDQSGCRALLSDKKAEDLWRMYKLFCSIPNWLEPMAAIVRQQIIDEGKSLALLYKKTEKKEEQACVELTNCKVVELMDCLQFWAHLSVWNYIRLHDKYLLWLKGSFANHPLFSKALKGAFEFFCNKIGGTLTAELLAIFCDSLLGKEDRQNLDEGEKIEDALEKAVMIFSYLGEKDLFAEFYRNKLARRLLRNKKRDDGHEKSMLTQLKELCGNQYTCKMEGMVADLSIAREIQMVFEDYLRQSRASTAGIQLSVRVFNTASWPNYRRPDLVLPAEMVRCVQVFTDFYRTKKPKQKLSWMFSLGTCTLQSVDYANLHIQLIMTPIQAAVLLLFDAENANTLSFAGIKGHLNLNDEDMVRILHSLSCGKHKILIKTQDARRVTPSDSFSLNMEFSSNTRRIKIPLPPMDDKKKVVKAVEADRTFAVDASIVKILKGRQVLSYQQVLIDCDKHLSPIFKPEIKLIKARIEHLIEREFLERDKDNLRMLRYIA